MEEHTRRHAEEHPLVVPAEMRTPEEYCLLLIHQRAYETAAEMAAGKRVLDVGCNTGYGTVKLSEGASCAVGVDVSAGALRTARESYRAPGLEFVRVDGERLPFAAESFELVTSFQVLEHIPDPGPYLDEIARVLRSGGTAIFTTPNAGIRLDPGMKPWNDFHVREYRAEELRAELASRFAEVTVRGLFAPERLYEIELGRVRRNREGAREREAPAEPPAPSPLGKLKDSLRRAAPAAYQAAADAKRYVRYRFIRSRFTAADLHYREEGLEHALDFMAVCRRA